MKATDSDWGYRGIPRVCFDARGNGDTRLDCRKNKVNNGKKQPDKKINSGGRGRVAASPQFWLWLDTSEGERAGWRK